jgi:hypothetical protein
MGFSCLSIILTAIEYIAASLPKIKWTSMHKWTSINKHLGPLTSMHHKFKFKMNIANIHITNLIMLSVSNTMFFSFCSREIHCI